MRKGAAGFSICYRAWDGETDEIVAIKEFYPRDAAERLPDGRVAVAPSLRDSFDAALDAARHEADVLQKLHREPAIVQVRDVVEENGTIYLVMEHLRGKSYAEYLRDHYDETGTHITPGTAIEVVLVVLGALGAVHERNLLHLDIKPENVRALDYGRIVLLDFGATRAAFASDEDRLINMLTPGFAAPEQHAVDGGSINATPATDIYGVAALLYYSLSLVVPTPADVRRSDDLDPPLPALNSAVSAELNAVIQKAMSLDPRDRYSSVTEFKDALKPFQTAVAPPVAGFPSTAARLAAGLFDIVAAMWLLVLLREAFALQAFNPLTSGILVWLALQMLPALTGATPGMRVTRLRLIGEDGGKVTFATTLARIPYQFLTLCTLRYSVDAEGLMPHDRITRSRVVLRKAITKILPSLAPSPNAASSSL